MSEEYNKKDVKELMDKLNDIFGLLTDDEIDGEALEWVHSHFGLALDMLLTVMDKEVTEEQKDKMVKTFTEIRGEFDFKMLDFYEDKEIPEGIRKAVVRSMNEEVKE